MMMMDKTEMPAAEELLRKIQRLEEAHRLKYLIIKQKKKKKKKISSSPSSSIISFSSSAAHKHDDDHKSSAETIGDSDWTETQYMNILESMGRPVYMFDVNNRIVYWNQMAENLYGYTVSEALGKTPPDIIVGPAYSELSLVIIQRVILKGETWSGQFPVRTKFGENFTVITTLSPCRHEENGTTFGVTCVCADPRPHFLHSPPTHHVPRMSMSSSTLTADDQPIQTASALVASEVKMKTKTTGETNMDCDHSDFTTTTDSINEGSDNLGSRLHKVFSLKAETWMGKTGISWPWKANENRESSDIRSHFGWPWLHYTDQGKHSGPQTSSSTSSKVERQQLLYKSPSNTKETPASPCSYSCGTSSSWSVDSNKTDFDTENLDVEILWDDLIIRQQIEQGCCS